MNNGLKTFLRLCALFTTISVVIYLVFINIRQSLMPLYFYIIPIYFIIASGVLAWIVNISIERKEFLSLPIMLGFRFTIVFLGLIVLLVGMFLDKDHVLSLSFEFVIYYIIFSIVETSTLVKLNKSKESK